MEPLTSGHSNPLPSTEAMHAHESVHLLSVGSTMDEAHARASRGAPAGTLIVADEQTAGRGRGGNSWESETDTGVWCTLIERPTDASAVDVLSIRLGLAVAKAVEPLAPGPVQLKWPNDLYVDGGKLAGILVEARWRENALDWVAIGIGLNLSAPRLQARAAALRPGTTRNDVLIRMIPSVRAAAQLAGHLTVAERGEWLSRDLSINRPIAAPVLGTVRGIELNGALRVEDAGGVMHELRAGSLTFT